MKRKTYDNIQQDANNKDKETHRKYHPFPAVHFVQTSLNLHHTRGIVSFSLQCIGALYGGSKPLIDFIVFISTRVKSWYQMQRAIILYTQFHPVLPL
jgi:hypothetical protein